MDNFPVQYATTNDGYNIIISGGRPTGGLRFQEMEKDRPSSFVKFF